MMLTRALLLIPLLWSCAQEEEKVCLQHRLAANQAALADRLDEAAEILAQVEGKCGANHDSGAQRVTKLIAERRKLHAEHSKREQASAEQRQQAPSREFSRWATSYDGSLHGKVSEAICAKRGQPDFGFCEVTRKHVPDTALRFWNKNRNAYRYELQTALPITCSDLGSYRHVRSWSVKAQQYELCELTGQKVRHLSALLVRAPGVNHMFLYSQGYPRYDHAFRQTLGPRAER